MESKMASVTATPVVTGNPNSTLRSNRVYTATFTAWSTSDTVTLPGGVTDRDIIVIAETQANPDTRYFGLCEAKASRSVANKTIAVVPVGGAPSASVTYSIIKLTL
jgi:hypothetical protein